MSAPHDETHEMHNEVATVARAMLSAGLAVADGRRQRQLRAARDAERALPQAPRTEPAAERASGPAPERATDHASTEQPTPHPGRGGTLPDPGGFSRRDIQQRADTMAATPGSAEHDARLRDVVSAAVPTTAQAVLADPAWPALRAGLRHIENNGGDPWAELAAAAGSRPLRGADSAARVLRWRLATRQRRAGPCERHSGGAGRYPGPGCRVGAARPGRGPGGHGCVLRRRRSPPRHQPERGAGVGRSAARREHRPPTGPGRRRRPPRHREHRPPRHRPGPRHRRRFLEGNTAAERPTAEQSPAPPHTMFSHGAAAGRLAGLSHPRSVAEQLATRTPGGQETPAARGREHDPIRHRDRSR